MSKRFTKIYVEITNYCNLACSFCSVSNLPKKEMSVKEFEIVLKKIKDYTKSIYLHVKGEPLLHSQIDEILDLCDKYQVKVNITTNGTLLEKKKDILLKHHIKQINISLHSENKDDNYFEKVFNICELLSKKMAIIYRIWIDNKSKTIIDKLEEYYSIDLENNSNKNIKLKNNIYLDKDIEFVWPKIDSNKDSIGTCLGTRSHIAILSNGTVVPCCLDSDAIIKLGNIFEENLETILDKPLFKEINLGFRENRIICDLCKSCSFRKRFDK